MVRKQRKSRPRRRNDMMSTTVDIVKVGVGATVGVGVIGAVAGALK